MKNNSENKNIERNPKSPEHPYPELAFYWHPYNIVIEQFSNECRKTETKVITVTNQNGNKTQNEPIRNRSEKKE